MRRKTNNQIIDLLRIVIRKHPLTNLDEIIKTYILDGVRNTFYEEPSYTLERLKERMSVLIDVPESEPSEIVSICLDRLNDIVDACPDQRFVQICENYLLGQCEDPGKWLVETEKKLYDNPWGDINRQF